MSEETAVSDTSPLIALGQIGAVDLLRDLFVVVLIPPAVRAEAWSVALPAWIHEQAPTLPLNALITAAALGSGEKETIGLALETPANYVILDDLPARRVAERLGLQVTGTLGVLLLAKQRRLLPAIRPHLAALRVAGFFFDERLYRHLLALAGE